MQIDFRNYYLLFILGIKNKLKTRGKSLILVDHRTLIRRQNNVRSSFYEHFACPTVGCVNHCTLSEQCAK